jgi:raffinose/stachyose/melibiose transport system substrate-binding protein
MKIKLIFLMTTLIIGAITLTSCGDSDKVKGGTEITVVTSYGRDDGNRSNYQTAFRKWEEQTGNDVIDESAMSDEKWKAKVNSDFDNGAEPDVLFFFVGADADKIISESKVISLEDIRAEYPSYGSNLNDNIIPVSTADGKKYALPTTGFWEALYVNKTVLEKSGVAIPGADYSWDSFMADSQKIKDAGFTPVAASLKEVPHYWWEYSVFNNDAVGTHLDIPKDVTDTAGLAWVDGLDDIKKMYDSGFFPKNTLTADDATTLELMVDGKAAFLIDGSWKIGWFQKNAADHLDDYIVTYVPAKSDRKASDIIGGFSMGYYITKKAWDDPVRREAAIDFVTYMTSDEVIATFSNGGVVPTALIIPPSSGDTSPFVKSAIDMFKGQSGAVPAVQDLLSQETTTILFEGISNVVSGSETATALVQEAIRIQKGELL